MNRRNAAFQNQNQNQFNQSNLSMIQLSASSIFSELRFFSSTSSPSFSEFQRSASSILRSVIISFEISLIDYDYKFSIVNKLYTDEQKYEKQRNNFVFKITIFYDVCNRVILFMKIKLLAFFIMLKRLTLNYYYFHISNISHQINFNQIYYMIDSYFERAEYRRITLNK